jgi:hypothetical protein
MSTAQLQQPILDDDAIRSINFFNGRLLTARDLTREQLANRNVDKRLGQAIGEGIAYGFEVSKSRLPQSSTSSPMLTVTAGLAINRRGQTLKLENAVDIGLVRAPAEGATSSQTFNECVPLQTGTYIAGAGVYLLTVAPAETREGLATTAGLERGIASCNTDTIVSALQFRLVQLNPPLTDTELDDENHLQNLIAYKCYGVTEQQAYINDLFGGGLQIYGVLDSLRPARLTDCDVPLAVLYWRLSAGIKFIDMWSVRRRLIDPISPDPWNVFTAERRLAEAEAMLLQFEDQIRTLRFPDVDPGLVRATDHFRYLPPVGLIPIHRAGSIGGFTQERFFQNVTCRRPVFIEGAKVESLFRNSLSCKPIDLVSGEMIWLYQVRENRESIARGGTGTAPYVIFANGYVPVIGDAQYDLSRWDYSNYSGL